MKVSWIVVVLLALGAGLVAFWATRMAICSRPARLSSYALGDVTHLKTELKLEDRQVAGIRLLEQKLAVQLADQCGQYCAMRAELGEALMREGSHSEEVSRRLVDRMCAIQSASELATLDHVRKVSALLNPEQRKTFLAGLTKCLCGSGGMCVGGCMDKAMP